MSLDEIKKKLELKKHNEDLKNIKSILKLEDVFNELKDSIKKKQEALFENLNKKQKEKLKEIVDDILNINKNLKELNEKNDHIKKESRDLLFRYIEKYKRKINNLKDYIDSNNNEYIVFVKNINDELSKLKRSYNKIDQETKDQIKEQKELKLKLSDIRKQATNAKGKRIRNVGDPQEPKDAANMEYVLTIAQRIRGLTGSGSINPTTTSSNGGGTWGSITGTLSDQTDLQNALNLKANTADLATVATSGDHTDLINIGTNTHTQIDSHISDSTIHFAKTIEDGTADGQMAYWDDTAGEWKHTETTELFWDDSNKFIKITSTGGKQLELVYDGSNNTTIDTNSDGQLVITPSGGELRVDNTGTTAGLISNRTDGVALNLLTGGANSNFLFDESGGFAIRSTTKAQVLNPPISSFTKILYATGDGDVGINQESPRERLDIIDTSGTQARFSYSDNSIYTNVGTDSSGNFNISPTNNTIVLESNGSPEYSSRFEGSELVLDPQVGTAKTVFGAYNVNSAPWSFFGNNMRIDNNLYKIDPNYSAWGFIFDNRDSVDKFKINYLGSNGTNNKVKFAIGANGSAYFGDAIDPNPTATSSDMFFDGSTARLGINQESPRERLDIIDTSGVQARLTYTDNSVYTNVGTDSNGYFNIDPTGLRTINDGALTISDNTLLATPVAGTFEFDNDRMYITNVSTQRAIDRTSDVPLTNITVENTTTETTLYTTTIGANDLKVGNVIEVQVSGSISNNSASDDITLRIKLGGTTLETFNPAIGNVTNDDWHIKGVLVVRTVGATGTYAFHGEIYINGNVDYANTTGTFDTTTNENITVTAQWDNANANNIITRHIGYTEWKN